MQLDGLLVAGAFVQERQTLLHGVELNQISDSPDGVRMPALMHER